MPILDWLRTNPNYLLANGSRALYFERAAFIAFDLFLLQRPNAEKDYSPVDIQLATARFASMNAEDKALLFNNVLLGLPGSDIPFTATEVLSALKSYHNIDRLTLKNNLYAFLNEIIPVAESKGLKMAIHPDDPPFSVLGLPRIMCTEADVTALLTTVPAPANGLCFCTGSFGARADNDMVNMVKRFGDRIHFLHLRNTKRDSNGNFYEANHLEGDTNIPAVLLEVLKIMNQKGVSIPMRPDHGHQMLDDLNKTTYPGYSAIGRLKGLAELRGVEEGLVHALQQF
jgi:mannonate dehydratase